MDDCASSERRAPTVRTCSWNACAQASVNELAGVVANPAGAWSYFYGPGSSYGTLAEYVAAPVILYNVIIDVINNFQVFAYAFVMTKGGPNDASLFYVLYIYRHAFELFQMGYASALSVILFVIILIFTVLLLKVSTPLVQYERL